MYVIILKTSNFSSFALQDLTFKHHCLYQINATIIVIIIIIVVNVFIVAPYRYDFHHYHRHHQQMKHDKTDGTSSKLEIEEKYIQYFNQEAV
jgi:membrane protein YdbS with pleckstrin-like domain